MLAGEDGFKNIINAVETPGSGLSVDDFMDEESVRYQVESRLRASTIDSAVSFCVEHRIPQMAEKQFDVAKRALRITGVGSAGFADKAPDIVNSLKSYNSKKYNNAATMIERFVSGREAIASNIARYEAIKAEILKRPEGEQFATEQERNTIGGELLVRGQTVGTDAQHNGARFADLVGQIAEIARFLCAPWRRVLRITIQHNRAFAAQRLQTHRLTGRRLERKRRSNRF